MNPRTATPETATPAPPLEPTLTEADLFRSYHDDGLLDLLAGAALTVMGVGWAAGLGPLATLQAPLWVLLWVPLRRRFVEPRAGYVRFSRCRRERTVRGLWWSLAMGVEALVLVAATAVLVAQRGSSPTVALLVPALPAVLVAVAASLAAVLSGARRFHAYALGLLAAGAATVAVEGGPAAPLAVIGIAVLGTGALLFHRFLRASRDFRDPA